MAEARPRLARGEWSPALLALTAVAVVGAGCGGAGSEAGSGSRSAVASAPEAVGATRVRVVSTEIGAPTPAPALAEVEGAAAPAPERSVPADIVPLASRMTPRALPIPPTARGNTARFTFEGHRRGWFTRVPGSGQALLTPVYHEGRVFLGGGFSSGQFFAYDARDGAPLWAAAAPAGGPTAAVVEDGKLLFNTESCTLFAIDVYSGEQAWQRWLGDPLMSQPAAGGGMVYSGHVIDGRSPGRVRPGATGWGVGGGRAYGFTALRLSDGQPRWTTRVDADVMNAPVLGERSVFFTAMNGVLYHLDRRNGRVRWRRELDATSAPWLSGRDLLVTARDDHEQEHTLVLDQRRGETLRAFDAVDAGFLRERADTGGVAAGWAYEGSRPTVHEDRMYQTIGNEVHCRDASSGALLWRRAYTEDASARPASSPAIAGGQLVFGTRAGVLYGLEIDSGLTTFAYDVGEPIAAQPTVAHGWVYAATTEGGLAALEVGDATFDGWHMWGGNAAHAGPTLGTATPGAAGDGSGPMAGGAAFAGLGGARPSEGTLRLDSEPNHGELGGFPLVRTDVSGSVHGFVARVRVEQTFTNPYERPVDASYLFPVPEGAAVDHMELRAGARRVRARIVERPALDAEPAPHRSTSIQDRPDLFRHTLRQIQPSEEVRVVLEYSQVMPYEGGAYRLPYPLRAGPRYTRAEAGGYNPVGTPLELALGPDDARPDAVAVELATDHARVRSESHRLGITAAEGGARATLRGDAPPDRDLDVRFDVAGEEPEARLLASPPREGDAGYFALALHPRLEVPEREIAPRELAVVIDTSSSMRGPALARMRAATERLLAGLRTEDRFRLVVLDDSSQAIEGGAGDLGRARAFLRGLVAEGTTGARDGLAAALTAPLAPERVRLVVLMSDGYLGNETELMGEVRERLGAARLYAFGVGTAVNRYLLTRLTEMGRGELVEVALDAPPADAAERLHAQIASPALTDLRIEWGGVEASDVYPRRLPDVFRDRPLVVHGRYARGTETQIVVHGRVAGRAFRQVLAIELPEAGPPRPELASVWARARIDDLSTAMALAPSPTLRREATELAVRHQLLTEWTAFEVEDTVEAPPPIPVTRLVEQGPLTERPAADTHSPVLGCYAQVRDDDGTIDPEDLARCLSTAAGP